MVNWKFWQKSKGTEKPKEYQRIPQDPDTIPQDTPRYINTFYTEEFSSLKPENLSGYIEWAVAGIPAFMYLLYETVRQRDLRLGTALMRRKFAVLDEKWIIKCEWDEGKKFAESVLSGLGAKLFKFFTNLVEANLNGLKRFEINYDLIDGKIHPVELIPVSNYLYLYDQKTHKLDFIDITQVDAMKLMSYGVSNAYDRTDFDTIPRVKIDPQKVLDVYGLDGDNRNPFLNGHSIGIVIGHFFKNYNVKDMNIFIERFASPTIDAQYDPVNPEAKSSMQKAISILKSFGYLIRPKGSEVNLLNDQSKGTAVQIFLNAIKYWDSNYTLRVLGEEETTKMGDHGSFGALKIKKYVSDDIMVADLKVITFAVNELLRRLCDHNFSKPQEYPVIEFIKVKTLEDQKTHSEIVSKIKDVGYRPTKEYIQENFDIEVEESETDPAQEKPKKEKLKAAMKFANDSLPLSDDMLDDYIDAIFNQSNN